MLLSDQFQERTVDLAKIEEYCDAVKVTIGSGTSAIVYNIKDPAAHLACYTVRRPISSATPVAITANQFGEQVFNVKKRRTRLCVPSDASVVPTATPSASPSPSATPPPGLPLDHYELYKIKRTPKTPKFEKRELNLADPFLGLNATVKLTRPTRLAVPTDKNEEGIANSLTHLTCYAVQAPRFQHKDVDVENQFGEFRVTVKRPYRLCVPSYKEIVNSN